MAFPTTNHEAEAQSDSLLIGGGEGHRGGRGIDRRGGTDRVHTRPGSLHGAAHGLTPLRNLTEHSRVNELISSYLSFHCIFMFNYNLNVLLVIKEMYFIIIYG